MMSTRRGPFRALFTSATRAVAERPDAASRTAPTLASRLLGPLLAAGLLGACVIPEPLPEPPDDASLTRVADPEARRLLAAGDPLAAADVYSARAELATDERQRDDYRLLAAEILFDRGLPEAGLERLARVPEELASPTLMHRRDILVAKGLLADGDPEAALLALPDPDDVADPLHRARVHETRAQTYRALDDPDNELLARIALEAEVRDPLIVERSREEIWQFLTSQPLSTLRTLTTNVRDQTYQGWVALALAHAEAGDDRARRVATLDRWRSLFPGHPAGGDFLVALVDPAAAGGAEGRGFEGREIERVAVLLPLSAGATSAPAAAIRDGIVAAWEHSRARGAAVPVLRFHDIGENAAYARTAYARAVAEGADAVIGPLRKDAVAAIVSQRRVPVPTVTLNTVDLGGALGERNPNIVQFGLAPEDEARAAAARAAALSLDNAIVLQSDDSRGDREAQAFRDELYARGGDVVHVAVLPGDRYDYSAELREALGIDDSDVRFRRLSATIGERLFFEPAIRNDVDVVFMALTSEQARSARPQLDFFRAREVPRLATSRVASLEDDEKVNSDLNSIYYADAPWVLRDSLADDPLRRDIVESFPAAEGAYAKLYALGIDAWRLVENLEALGAGERLEGYTGELELGVDGRVRRHLDWAQYVEGVSVPVERIEVEPLGEIRSTAAAN